VPYADYNNPQSLNLYAFVLDNPLSHRDADGHSCDPDTYSKDSNGNLVVHAGSCNLDFFPLVAAVGHHFVDLALIRAKDGWNSLAGQFFRRLTTGPLQNPGVHRGYSTMHRLNSEQIRQIIENVEQKTARQFGQWNEEDINMALDDIQNAGGDVQAFLEQIASDDPTARTIRQDAGGIMDAAIKAYNTTQSNPTVQAVEGEVEEIIDEVDETCGGSPAGCVP